MMVDQPSRCARDGAYLVEQNLHLRIAVAHLMDQLWIAT